MLVVNTLIKVSLYLQVTVTFRWYPEKASSWNLHRCLLMSVTISDVLQKKLLWGIVPCFNKVSFVALQQPQWPDSQRGTFTMILWSQREFYGGGIPNNVLGPTAIFSVGEDWVWENLRSLAMHRSMGHDEKHPQVLRDWPEPLSFTWEVRAGRGSSHWLKKGSSPHLLSKSALREVILHS